jgi:nitroreductase
MSFNDTSSVIALLHSRRSGKARDLALPAPDDNAMHDILSAAIRVPDHGKLNPWRFVIIGPDRRMALADVIEAAYRADKAEAGPTEIAAVRAYALEGPQLVVALFEPKAQSHIPLWEQQLSMGAAIQNAMIAAHGLGFAANWLTGWSAYSAAVCAALGGGADTRIAGFLYFGTPTRALEERPRPDYGDVIRRF